MAKKSKKKFKKKELLSIFEKRNYRKVISKVKQFEIYGMDEKELNNILVISYQKLAEEDFDRGDIKRAIRNVNSLLEISDKIEFRLTLLKYLCYNGNFDNAIKLAEELISQKDKKIKRQVSFFYLMAKLYKNDYGLDKKLLNILPASRKNYILGFRELMMGRKELALQYLNRSNPRSSIEKKNVKVVRGIVSQEENDIEIDRDIKPFYRFLINGRLDGVHNSNSFANIRKEIINRINKNKTDRDILQLLRLEKPTSTNIILEKYDKKEEHVKLILNNISLLLENKRNSDALDVFIEHHSKLVKLVESINILMNISTNNKKNPFLSDFIDRYLSLHYKKLAPFFIDEIFFYVIRITEIIGQKEVAKLTKKYGREHIFFLTFKFIVVNKLTYDEEAVKQLNLLLKNYSMSLEELFDINLKVVLWNNDKIFNSMNHTEQDFFKKYVVTLIQLMDNLDKPHPKYKSLVFNLLSFLACTIQNFDFIELNEDYIRLSNIIEKFIIYYGVDKLKLPVDIKMLFLAIKNGMSLRKREDIFLDIDNLFSNIRDLLLRPEDRYDEYIRDVMEYDIQLIVDKCVVALDRNEETPFKILSTFFNKREDSPYIIHLILELLREIRNRGKDEEKNLKEIFININIKPYDSPFKEYLVKVTKQYEKTDNELKIALFEYLLKVTPTTKRETVWYLKWIEEYLYIVNSCDKKGELFYYYLDFFLSVQRNKKFKTLGTKYKKIIKKFGKGRVLA